MEPFTGQADGTIDAKSRMAIPSKFRKKAEASGFGKHWVCYSAMDQDFLQIYTKEYFTELVKSEPFKLDPGRSRAEWQRQFFGSCEEIEVDSAGRLAIPKWQQDRAKLKSDVVVVGAGDKLEVHDASRWRVATGVSGGGTEASGEKV